MSGFVIVGLYNDCMIRRSDSEEENQMESNKLDRIFEAEELVQGLLDTIYAIQTARQDVVIPITILSTFEAVLRRVDLLLKEAETNIKI